MRLYRLLPILLLGLLLAGCDSSDPDPDPPTVTGVTIESPTTDLTASATLQLTATVEPASAPQGVRWTSSDEMIATVDADGLVTGVATGAVSITATSTADPTKSASVQLDVSDCPPPREVAQIVGSDQTWENWIAPSQCVDYVVPDGFTNQGHLLTIEPGVRAAFGPRAVLLIRSHSAGIRAVGTEEEPIVLTGMAAERGNWGTLWLDGSAHVENRIEHVTIEYGGDANLSGSITQGNLLLTGDTETTLRNVTVQESSSFGLSMAGNTALRDHGENTFTRNAAGPAHVNASQAHFLDATSSASGNDVDLIGVDANDIETAVTWVPMGDGYLIEQESDRYAFDVRGADAFLTLEPGVRIVFQEDMAMTVAGGAGIAALGTEAAPVVLTAEQPTRGFWRGFRVFSANANSRFDRVVVEYGGGDTHSGSVQPGNVYLDRDAAITISNSVLREGAGYGLVAEEGASLPDFAENNLTANVLGAAHVRATVAADLTANSSYTGNVRDAIDVYAYTSRITTPTEWEDLGVPYVIRGRTTGVPNGLFVDDVPFTLGEGVEILFQGDVGLSVTEGALQASGTPDNPVRLAGEGEAWKGVRLGNSSASFNHTTFEGAGTSSWGGQPAGAVTINVSGGGVASANFGAGTTHTGTVADYGLVFGPGNTTANCAPMEPVYIPTTDEQSDHCL